MPLLSSLRGALNSLRQDIGTMYGGQDRAAAELRATQLGALARVTGAAMLINMANVALMLWALRSRLSPGLALWGAVVVLLAGLALLRWWPRRHRVAAVASSRAAHRATLHATVLAVLWALLPLGWFADGTPQQQLLLGTVTTGMMGGGCFVLSPLPLASLAWVGVMGLGALLTLARLGQPELMPLMLVLVCYGTLVALGALGWWRTSLALWRAQAEAVRQERVLAVLLQDFEQNAGEALWETGPDGVLRHQSQRLAELLDLPAEQLSRQPLLPLLAARCSAGAAPLQQALDAGRPFRELGLTLTVDGRARHLLVNGKRLVDDLGRTRGWRGVVADITDKVQAEQQLRQLAHTDSLTGLANRFTLRDTLAARLREGGRGALLAIDLDHFKAVNDSLGHSAGDQLLTAVAQRLRHCLRDGDMVARLGGDEFAVLMTQAGGADDATQLARRVVAALAQPVPVQGRALRVGASVGVALWDGGALSVDELLVRADTALYAAKEAGRGQHALYAAEMGERSRRRSDVEAGLAQAAQRGQLALHWQPKVRIASWQVASAEALLRWQHPTLGPMSPAEFIPVAEQCGLIDALGEWALDEACRAASGPLAGLCVSVNVSPLQLRSGRLVGTVRDALRRHGTPPGRLELEITESVFMDDASGALEQLHALRSLGVRVALDDFGTGYSSLAYLRRFPFDTLKIDRAFVSELLLRRDARAIVHMIANLATTLGMRTVCEGVETAQQLAAVSEAGCEEIQGYLVSRPRPLDEFVQLLAHWQPQPPQAAAPPSRPAALH
jgi:diguanylate cyclase (GGDEF)-like protein/PAS domain S-box-containing protein